MRRTDMIFAVIIIAASFSESAVGQGVFRCQTFPQKLVSAAELLKFSTAAIKGEYETTAEFQTRIMKFLPTGQIAIEIPLPASETSYDADRGILNIREYALPLAERIVDTDQNFVGWLAPVVEKRKPTGSYAGQNAFGAKTHVIQENDASLGIAWDSAGPHFNPDADLKIDMVPNQAKSVRNELGILLVGTLSSPPTVRSESTNEATVSDPIELTKIQVGVVVRPVCAAVYDRLSHSILTSWPAATGYKPSYLP